MTCVPAINVPLMVPPVKAPLLLNLRAVVKPEISKDAPEFTVTPILPTEMSADPVHWQPLPVNVIWCPGEPLLVEVDLMVPLFARFPPIESVRFAVPVALKSKAPPLLICSEPTIVQAAVMVLVLPFWMTKASAALVKPAGCVPVPPVPVHQLVTDVGSALPLE